VSEKARLDLMKENNDLSEQIEALKKRVNELEKSKLKQDKTTAQETSDKGTLYPTEEIERARENTFLVDLYEKFTGLSLNVTDTGAIRCVQNLKTNSTPLVFELTPCHDEEDIDENIVDDNEIRKETLSQSRSETISGKGGFLMFDYEPINVPTDLPNYLNHSMLFGQDKTMAFYHRLIKEWM
jgi:cell division septum initiation protein DivIVA